MGIIRKFNKTPYNDAELIEAMREGSDALSLVYSHHKTYCLNFMRKMHDDEEEIKDIYQDAIIVLYEKFINPDFTLSCNIQTFLNSICRNQLLKRFKEGKSRRGTPISDDNLSEILKDVDFIDSIDDWLDQSINLNDKKSSVLYSVLEEWKKRLSKCYDIITRFWYRKETMNEIANKLGFLNADSAKNQKNRCQRKLELEVFKLLEAWKE